MSIMKYQTKIVLYNSYFDANDRLTPKSILNIFQDIAAMHAEELGVGHLPMIEKNLYWVLSRIKFDIIKMPNINQTVIVETWPQVKGKIDFDRDMRVLDENGEILIIGTSKWCVIDSIKRMLQRADNIIYNGEYYMETNYNDRFNKIDIPNKSMNKTLSYPVMFSDLDHNKHMNNTNYANLISNSINNKEFTHFEINFLSECLLNDVIDVFYLTNENEEYIIGKVGEKVAFNAFIK